MSLAEELAAKGTHFHQGEVVIYTLINGCGFQYHDGVECPACMGIHVCGKGCS